MKLTFKPYRRRDGSWMIYLNNDRKVSVGISSERGFGPTTKHTAGQKKLIDAAKVAFEAHAEPFTGDIAAHDEPQVACGPYTLLITDVGTIGGQQVGEDGAYIVRDGKFLRAGRWVEVVE